MVREGERRDGTGGWLAAVAAAALLAVALATALHRAAAVADGFLCMRCRTTTEGLQRRLATAESRLARAFAELERPSPDEPPASVAEESP